MMQSIRIALAGNPNIGKTTLLNALTGTKHYVGNWPGVTVEKKEGHLTHHNTDITVVDLPGTYSLSAYSLDEKIARNYIIDECPDVIINIVDASNLERNLYLTIQLLELGRPIIMALNMMDEAKRRGFNINIQKLSDTLGIPIVPIVAKQKKGLDKLLDAVIGYNQNTNINDSLVNYGDTIEPLIHTLSDYFTTSLSTYNYHTRWLALKILERDEAVIQSIGKTSDELLATIESVPPASFETDIADKKYEFISTLIDDIIIVPTDIQDTFSSHIDDWLTHKWLGIPFFIIIVLSIFKFTFSVGNYFSDKIDYFFSIIFAENIHSLLTHLGTAPWVDSLVVDGIIGGVGGVITFLPLIVCLFLALSILEDSGYMSRVAFILDRLMRKIGLNGKAIIPMLIGFGCSVPAIMGTRTLENENDRLTAILINPFMSCSARLPVYTLFAAAFFPGHEWLVISSLYFLGIIVAISMGLFFKHTLFRSDGIPFIMELPPYHIPSARDVLIHVWERAKGFLTKAGTIIFAASAILWVTLNFNFSGPADMTNSIGAYIGNVLVPIFSPLGFGTWQTSLSLLTGLVAKEIIVSNMSIIYGLAENVSAHQFAQTLNGTFTALTAYTFLVFILLYTPCVAAIGAIKRETNSWKWTFFSIGYQFGIAWIVAFLVYQFGLLFGF